MSQSTVHHWVHHAHGQRLDRVDWHDRPHTTRTPSRTDPAIEDLVLTVRTELERVSDLGFHGAEVIHEALKSRKVEPLPSVRTIHRILERRGALDGQRRTRRPAPPPGWHLPEVASKRQELDSFDVVEGLVIKGGPQIEVHNGVSLHGGWVGSWPVEASVTAKVMVASLVEPWRVFGRPSSAQFDNDYIDLRLTKENITGEQFVKLLEKLLAKHPETEKFILYLDNARYYSKPVVKEWLARHRQFHLVFLPAYSPNLNLIERLWKFLRKEALNRWHKTFEAMQGAVAEVLDHLDRYRRNWTA